MKKLLTTLLALSLSGIGSTALAQRGPAPVFAQPVETRPFSLSVEALGTLEPNEQVDLTLNVADRVRSIYFDDGQRVRKGKTLLSLAQREQIALTEAAEANVDEARQRVERLERLIERKAVSQSELEAAQRDLNSASAQLRAVQSRQKDRVLVAPFDGVLGFRQVSVGSFVRAGDVVARLIDDSEMNLEFSVPSIFLRSLKPGTLITARTDDFPGEVFDGKIATLDNAIDPVTRAVSVRATLPNPDQLLLSGMFMQVTLFADPRDALAIPEEAIQPVGPKTFVYVVETVDGKPTAQQRVVKIGARSDGYVEILDGLTEGERVITEGIIRLRQGGEVVLKDKSMLSPAGNARRNGGNDGGGNRSAGASAGK